MMEFTRSELERAHLLLVVDRDGNYRYSAYRSDTEIVAQLRKIADQLEHKIEIGHDRKVQIERKIL